MGRLIYINKYNYIIMQMCLKAYIVLVHVLKSISCFVDYNMYPKEINKTNKKYLLISEPNCYKSICKIR